MKIEQLILKKLEKKGRNIGFEQRTTKTAQTMSFDLPTRKETFILSTSSENQLMHVILVWSENFYRSIVSITVVAFLVYLP